MDLTLPQQMCFPGNGMSDFPKNYIFVEKLFKKSISAIICLNFTFSTIYLVNNGHRAIKVHVYKANIAELVTLRIKEEIDS